jgi:membrane-associated phospholipid phosphatase
VRDVSTAETPRTSPARSAALTLAALTAIAALFVGLALIGRAIDVTGVDRSVARDVQALFSAQARGTMRVLTHLGALQVALPLTLLVALVLAGLRDRRAALGLLVAYAATQAIVTLVKVLVARDRPAGSDPLDHVGGYAFPSGHSATAVAVYGALALIAARHLGPRARVAAIALAIVLAAVVGTTRVYLGVHYPTDVLGGWLLGTAVLGVTWRLLVTPPAP